MFNDSKKNNFLTEAKTVYSEASKKYIAESMKDSTNSNHVYCKSNTDSLNPINLSGRDINYYVKTDASVNLEITFCGVKVKSTKTSLEKINFPFGTAIEATNGIIGYVISDEDGIYVPYYQKNGWYNENDRVLNITGGIDIENQSVIDWFKKHGERVK